MSSTGDVPKNWEIKVPQVRLIDVDGRNLGVFKTKQALDMAREKGLDLVLVAPNSDPPVARIMDYGKYKYEKEKKQREARKKQKQTELKQMKFRLKIDDHDFYTKLNHVKRFLQRGDKVRITIMFRGREMAFTDQGYKLLERIRQELEELAEVETPPVLEGRDMRMTLRPKK
ncbi:MAG TPA: translation initiation factor IF-3 [Thermotogae bacterium]|nr:translation initiation factor IF-3 [Thermotogota bacterium]